MKGASGLRANRVREQLSALHCHLIGHELENTRNNRYSKK
jgi:hypothetical protein